MPGPRTIKDTLAEIAKKRGMMIPHTITVEKRIPADSNVDLLGNAGAYLRDRIQGPYNPNNPDNKMKKDLRYAPYYYDMRDKKHLIKKA